MRVIKELLAAGGHPNATVEERREEVSATSLAITFDVDEGDRVRVVEIQFEGNTVFSDGALRGAMKYVKEAGLITRVQGLRHSRPRETRRMTCTSSTTTCARKAISRRDTVSRELKASDRNRTGFPVLPLPFLVVY